MIAIAGFRRARRNGLADFSFPFYGSRSRVSPVRSRRRRPPAGDARAARRDPRDFRSDRKRPSSAHRSATRISFRSAIRSSRCAPNCIGENGRDRAPTCRHPKPAEGVGPGARGGRAAGRSENGRPARRALPRCRARSTACCGRQSCCCCAATRSPIASTRRDARSSRNACSRAGGSMLSPPPLAGRGANGLPAELEGLRNAHFRLERRRR